MAFDLFECTLSVRRLKHSYVLMPEGGVTVEQQRIEYELKFGLVGKLLDAMMVRKKCDSGIEGFFAGLKHFVETGQRPSGKE